MKTFFSLLVTPVQNVATASNNDLSYMIGGIIAVLILGFLIYTLMHPEKF
jgi:K+-transporting ATPase KdpF subunit